MAETGILLESGTNEIEIMEFTIDGELYGINVAKVKEIMMTEPVKPVPHAHPSVEGIFKPRGVLLTVINLPYYLTGVEHQKNPKDLFIVTSFNQLNIAFRVHSVEGISRISWKDMQKPDKTVTNGEEGVTTGIASCEGRLVTILDFEKIVTDIAPDTGIRISDVDELRGSGTDGDAIVLAEDSILLMKMIEEALCRAGYMNLKKFGNGQEAWDYLSRIREDSDLDEKVRLVITDIEMPEMDGHRLTKLIKSDDILKKIPVVIFSSLINPEMRRKGEELGADDQLSKPEISKLVSVIDRLLGKGEA